MKQWSKQYQSIKEFEMRRFHRDGVPLATGAAIIGLAILASNTKGLAEIIVIVTGTYSGPVLGIFLIGFFLPKCNIKGVWTGFILSYVMIIWKFSIYSCKFSFHFYIFKRANFSMYQISYTLNGGIGFLICITLAIVVSFLTGNEKIEEVSPKYVSPYVHKFYWTKEEINTIKRNEENLDIENTKNEEYELENCPLNLNKINNLTNITK
ncbi:hypothetical protein Anas_05556 [Armadillidium nasatum]|uniref:Sodium-coupled monocarboxylate transporter 2 n=1 Tax=Armadillidium nasatum TaxID=96803 RepID=A0A5N5SXC0_9CRUS|nr:hypothetical protein Anas_05556 [Armadillidium nasatum]